MLGAVDGARMDRRNDPLRQPAGLASVEHATLAMDKGRHGRMAGERKLLSNETVPSSRGAELSNESDSRLTSS
jgi:hypothetical protein